MKTKMDNVRKYILLGISIIAIIITICLFIKFKDKDDNVNRNNIVDEKLLSSWSNGKVFTYQNDLLINEESLDRNTFLLITKSDVSICSVDENLTTNCNNFTYTYQDNKLSIDTDNYFLASGKYSVSFNDEQLLLEKKENDIKTIYKFESPKG